MAENTFMYLVKLYMTNLQSAGACQTCYTEAGFELNDNCT